jgi:hypothetical protein
MNASNDKKRKRDDVRDAVPSKRTKVKPTIPVKLALSQPIDRGAKEIYEGKTKGVPILIQKPKPKPKPKKIKPKPKAKPKANATGKGEEKAQESSEDSESLDLPAIKKINPYFEDWNRCFRYYIDQQPPPVDFWYKWNPGKGDCMYYAIAQSLGWYTDKYPYGDWRRVKREALDYYMGVVDGPDTNVKAWFKRLDQDSLRKLGVWKGRSIRELLQRHGDKGWGTTETLIVVTVALGVEVLLFQTFVDDNPEELGAKEYEKKYKKIWDEWGGALPVVSSVMEQIGNLRDSANIRQVLLRFDGEEHYEAVFRWFKDPDKPTQEELRMPIPLDRRMFNAIFHGREAHGFTANDLPPDMLQSRVQQLPENGAWPSAREYR